MFRMICLPTLLMLGGLMLMKYGANHVSTVLVIIGVITFGMGTFGGIMPYIEYMTDDSYVDYEEDHKNMF